MYVLPHVELLIGKAMISATSYLVVRGLMRGIRILILKIYYVATTQDNINAAILDFVKCVSHKN